MTIPINIGRSLNLAENIKIETDDIQLLFKIILKKTLTEKEKPTATKINGTLMYMIISILNYGFINFLISTKNM